MVNAGLTFAKNSHRLQMPLERDLAHVAPLTNIARPNLGSSMTLHMNS